jgi:hypothetical protein
MQEYRIQVIPVIKVWQAYVKVCITGPGSAGPKKEKKRARIPARYVVVSLN